MKSLSEAIKEMESKINEKLSKTVIENLISFLNKQLSFKVDDLVSLEHSKRDYLALSDIHNKNGTDKRYDEIVKLSKAYGGKLFRVGDNGGLGIVIHVLDKDKFKSEIVDEAKSEAEVMKPFLDKAVKELKNLFDQAKAGYGEGNANGHVAEAIKKAIPSNQIKWIQKKL